ncbi:MAG: hypothetical protein M3N53_13085 [Actinomycetota bacterium]|nr:hypothetical protein [Actinomycetota bacterium]
MSLITAPFSAYPVSALPYRLSAGRGMAAEEDKRDSIAPELTEVEELKFDDPFELMSPEERKKMRKDLQTISEARRRAESSGGNLRLS